MILLAAKTIPIDWVAYCVLTPNKQLAWDERGDELNKAMLYLMNSKNKQAKKDLHLVYSQGNMTAYPTNIEAMAQYLSTQYTNNKPANQHISKKEIKIREMVQNLKTKTATHVTSQVHTLKILQQLKNPALLAEGLVSALTFWSQMYSCPVHCLL